MNCSTNYHNQLLLGIAKDVTTTIAKESSNHHYLNFQIVVSSHEAGYLRDGHAWNIWDSSEERQPVPRMHGSLRWRSDVIRSHVVPISRALERSYSIGSVHSLDSLPGPVDCTDKKPRLSTIRPETNTSLRPSPRQSLDGADAEMRTPEAMDALGTPSRSSGSFSPSYDSMCKYDADISQNQSWSQRQNNSHDQTLANENQQSQRRVADIVLPDDVWLTVFKYLDIADLRNVMLVGSGLRQLVIPVLYSEVVFSEWAGRGLRLAIAIQQCRISVECTRHIKRAKICFTSLIEIMQTLNLLALIKTHLSGLERITLVSHRFEEAVFAANLLDAHYPNVKFEIHSEISSEPTCASQLSKQVLAKLELLRTPLVLRSALADMVCLRNLEVKTVIHDCDCKLGNIPRRAALSHADWVALECPHIQRLELNLWRSESMTIDNCLGFIASSDSLAHPDGVLVIDNPALLELKIESDSHYSSAAYIHLLTPSLQTLVFANIPPSVVENTLTNSEHEYLEFISLEPASVAGLRGITKAKLPALRSVTAQVMPTSFEVPCAEAIDVLVTWINKVSLGVPIIVKDYVGLVHKRLKPSDRLWCSLALPGVNNQS